MSFPPQDVRLGLEHLHAADPILGQVIHRVGPFRMTVEPRRFLALARSIVSQQISGHAARAIWKRLEQLVAPKKISASTIGNLTLVDLRTAGISPQKAAYLLDLAGKVENGHLKLHPLARLSDEEVIEELVQVKGIGVWTAQMFLMFSLGRMDVFPHGDLGVRTAIQRLYGFKQLPSERTSHRVARPWKPYATIASWYCWRSLEFGGE